MKYFIFSILLFFSVPLWAQQKEDCQCCSVSEHLEFDFWVGDWDVYSPEGKLVGRNTVTKGQDECLLVENWRSEGGKFTGTSYNHYNPQSKQWIQLWVDNQGGHLELLGGMVGNSMVLSSKPTPNKEGIFVINKVTWEPLENGEVRQHWEASKDYGKTWETVFDGLYRKAK